MAEITEPSKLPRFATIDNNYDHDNDVVAEPIEAKKSRGWFARIPPLPYADDSSQDMPPFRYMNWLHRWTFKWAKYFSELLVYFLGTNNDEALAIASNSISPNQEGVKVSTSGGLVEELQTADQTELKEGRLLMVRPNGDTNIIDMTFNDAAAGRFMPSNQMTNRLKKGTHDIWLFIRDDTDWREIIRPQINKPLGRGRFVPLMQTTFGLANNTGRGQTLSVGSHPFDAAFDGTYIWVTLNGASQVSKIDPATCQVVQTVSVGSGPKEIYFCGRWIWVANSGGNSISKIDPLTDTVVATITDTYIDNPRGMVLSGDYIWVCNYDRNAVCRIDRVNNTIYGSEISVGTGPIGIDFDGTYLYAANYSSSDLTKITAATGAVVGTYSAVGTNPVNVLFDGIYVWVSNDTSGDVSKVDISSTPTKVSDYTVGTNPRGLAFDGINVWAFNYGSDDISVVDANNGTVIKTYSAIDQPNAGAFDGIHVWVPNYDDNLMQRVLSPREYR